MKLSAKPEQHGEAFIIFIGQQSLLAKAPLAPNALMPHNTPDANLRQKPRHPSPARLLRTLLLDAGQTGLEVPLGHHAGDIQFH